DSKRRGLTNEGLNDAQTMCAAYADRARCVHCRPPSAIGARLQIQRPACGGPRGDLHELTSLRSGQLNMWLKATLIDVAFAEAPYPARWQSHFLLNNLSSITRKAHRLGADGQLGRLPVVEARQRGAHWIVEIDVRRSALKKPTVDRSRGNRGHHIGPAA